MYVRVCGGGGENLGIVFRCCSLSFPLKILPCEFFLMR